ncbi:OmpH family outer membrane protein [Pectinatus sottacetonis]|uniref:OmpH family outer membrane protein n=1 Tax=Pectinatus sottacetonis TaxID=1002795 RepID=UPI0018C7E5BD|nr:OmpH family outer membrane protein [Pectinatus sottacetonis]
MNQKMRKVLIIVAVTIAACFVLTGCSNNAKIGYVDLERVSNESPQIKNINKNFENEYKTVSKQMEDLMQKQGSMPKDEYTKEVGSLRRKAYGIQQKYTVQRQNLMNKVLAEIVKEKGLSAVTVKSSVGLDPEDASGNAATVDGVVVQGGIDITDEVIQKLH